MREAALVVVLTALFLSTQAFARDLFLSPAGSDEAAGTRAAPWQTLSRAGAAARPGDTIILLPGVYPGCLEPATSGEKERPITFRAEKPLAARLSGGGKAADGTTLCVRLKGREYIVLEGLDFEPAQPQRWLQLEDCRYCTLRGLRMQNGGGAYIPAAVVNSHYCRFESLDVSRAMQTDANGHVVGNMLQFNASTHNVIQDCRFGRAGHDPFCMWIDSTHNVVRRCVFNCVWGRNFEFFTAPHNLIEGCVITNGYHGSGSADGRAKLFLHEGIFRRNLITRNWYQPLTIHAYKYGDMDPFGMIDSRLYHNTFYRNYESGFEMFDIAQSPDPHMVRGNVLQNNLFADNDPGGEGLQLNLDVGIARDNCFVSNVFSGGKPGTPAIRYAGSWGSEIAARPKSQLRTAAEANAALPRQFRGNRDGAPHFLSTASDDFRPGKGSAALEAGTALTVAREGGRGKLLPVEDARPFYDGFGIPGEMGDLLFIGPRKLPARVVWADVGNQRLQLDRDVVWQTGDAVTLPYTGKAPDAGAYESGAEKEPWYLAPRPTPDLRISTMETTTGPFAVCGFEVENLEDWFYWWYGHRQRNCVMRVDDSTSATGKRSLRIEATDDKSTLSALIQPPWWDIDRYPMVRFSYRIPPATPVGVRLDAFPTEQRGYGAMYAGGTAARSRNANDLGKVALVDDDQWHEAAVDVRVIREVYPDVKLLRTFYFYTNANGLRGQRFWFDDFRIEQQ